ncbi:MAG: L,D-transpeptidase family protein [Rhodospirillales bacterium]|nr:L,D-transpeptidase family protein [Rhodospirillales bacterium]MDE2391382.1 L,D-transpeptidase family protein [Rhodospirillales bacterium]
MVEFVLRDGTLRGAGLILRAAHGRGGITTQKREGDGGTPAGLLRLMRVLYRADRIAPPRCGVPLEPISPHDGWCDDPADAAYNKPVRLPCPASHEELWRADGVYDVIGVLDWNLRPIVPGCGSAIFFHVATPDYAPTAGCVALSLPDVLAALAAGMSGIRVVG